MSLSAIRVYSPISGYLSEGILAKDIKSREDARKLGPFCDSTHSEMMLWVNWGTRKDGRKIKPYFRRYADKKVAQQYFRERIQEEVTIVERTRTTHVHQKIRDCLESILNKLIEKQKAINWAYTDVRLTDFPLSGNLLSDVIRAEKEYKIRPPFCGREYRLDIALLGEKIHRKPIVLGAIEIEYTHEAELLKTLVCKSCGFPVFTLNIKDATEDEITDEWCMQRLLETSETSGNLRRRNYIYIHNMLYPVFLSNYDSWEIGEKHQYLVFITDEKLNELRGWLETLRQCLRLTKADVNIMVQNINPNDQGSKTLFENEGPIAGHDWREYNPKRFIRIILKRPREKQGPLYKYHLALTQLLTLRYDCLVGYKIQTGHMHEDKERPIWHVKRKELVSEKPIHYIWHEKRFCPKKVSEPVRKIIEFMPRKI